MNQSRFLILFVTFIFLISCTEKGENLREDTIARDTENFHLYLLMGQSNMAGRGKFQAIDTLTHPRVLMLDEDLKWTLAKDPIHFDKPAAGVGLGLTFGKIMANENPEIKIGLIPTAVGGSSINAWFRDSLHQQTNVYPYNDMILRAKQAMKEGTLKGILWHQGESDTGSEDKVAAYSEKFFAMLDSFYKDLEIEPVPIVIGEIGHFFFSKAPLSKSLNDQLKQIASDNKCIGLVNSEGLNHKGDSTHFDSNSYHELGRRFAAQMIEVQSNCENSR